MATLTRPGVYVDESSFPTYVSATPGVASACFVGPCPRGPLTPTIVNSWKQFTQNYGGFETAYPPSNLHLAVYAYFSAGGTTAVIIRVFHPDTSGTDAATWTADDQNTAGAVPTLTINASSPGTWGNNIYIDILPGTILDQTSPNPPLSFTIQVKYQGTNPVNVVERWENLSMVSNATNAGVNNYALDIVNSPYTGSKYITLVDLDSDSPTPQDNPQPTAASTPLSGGSDGLAVGYQDYYTATQLLDRYPDQPFVLNVTGDGVPVSDATTLSNIISYAESRGDMFVVVDCPSGIPDVATIVQTAQLLGGSAQTAFYYPQVQIADPYSPVAGRTRLIPPGGFVVGTYIKTDATRSVAKAPAGLGTSLVGATGLEWTISNDDQGTLTQGNVNCLIAVPGSGIVVWGARTLSQYLVTRYVSVERSLIYLQTQLVALTKFAVFEPNDWVLWNSICSVISQFLNGFWQSGGLSGTNSSQAYYVTCDDTINTPQSIQQGIVNVEVGVALQFPAEFVVISIGQWAGGQSVSTSTT
jgi:uncharacterized protein